MIDTFIIPALTVALPSIGFIAGALFAGYRVKNAFELLDEAQRLNDKLSDEGLRLLAAVERLVVRNREYALAESKRQEQRRAAGEEGRKVQAASRTAARHLRMEAAEQRSAMKVAAE